MRTDIDVAISTWVPGYVAQRVDDLEVALAAAREGEVVVIDLAGARGRAWSEEMRSSPTTTPVVVLRPRDDEDFALPGSVEVSSPLTLDGLVVALEEVRSPEQGSQRTSTATSAQATSDAAGSLALGGGVSSLAPSDGGDRPRRSESARGRADGARSRRSGPAGDAAEYGRPSTELPAGGRGRRSQRRGAGARWSLWRLNRRRTAESAVLETRREQGQRWKAWASRRLDTAPPLWDGGNLRAAPAESPHDASARPRALEDAELFLWHPSPPGGTSGGDDDDDRQGSGP